jgi:cytochrome c oxidase subunit 4
MSAEAKPGSPAPHAGEGASPRALTYTLIALLVLAGLSLALRFAHLGGFSFLAALVIAVVKAVLVAVVFMEFLHEKPTVRFAFATGLSLFALLVVLLVADVLTRAIPPLSNPPGTGQRYHG